jgi:hypothetical protein
LRFSDLAGVGVNPLQTGSAGDLSQVLQRQVIRCHLWQSACGWRGCAGHLRCWSGNCCGCRYRHDDRGRCCRHFAHNRAGHDSCGSDGFCAGVGINGLLWR